MCNVTFNVSKKGAKKKKKSLSLSQTTPNVGISVFSFRLRFVEPKCFPIETERKTTAWNQFRNFKWIRKIVDDSCLKFTASSANKKAKKKSNKICLLDCKSSQEMKRTTSVCEKVDWVYIWCLDFHSDRISSILTNCPPSHYREESKVFTFRSLISQSITWWSP